jgi:hypothetical protein
MKMEIVSRSLDGSVLNEEEIAQLLRIPLFSRESAMSLSPAGEKSERASNSLAEVHAQVWPQCRCLSEPFELRQLFKEVALLMISNE